MGKIMQFLDKLPYLKKTVWPHSILLKFIVLTPIYMLLLAHHSCGTLGTYIVLLQKLIIHEQGKKKDGGFSKAAFCPRVEDEKTLKLLKMGNVRTVILLKLDFAIF